MMNHYNKTHVIMPKAIAILRGVRICSLMLNIGF